MVPTTVVFTWEHISPCHYVQERGITVKPILTFSKQQQNKHVSAWHSGSNTKQLYLSHHHVKIVLSLYFYFYFQIIFFRSTFVGSAWSFVFFIPATTANDLRLRRIFYPRFYPLHLFSYLNSWERASIFPFECTVLNKGTTGTIFIMSLVWRCPWLGIWTRDRPHSKPALYH